MKLKGCFLINISMFFAAGFLVFSSCVSQSERICENLDKIEDVALLINRCDTNVVSTKEWSLDKWESQLYGKAEILSELEECCSLEKIVVYKEIGVDFVFKDKEYEEMHLLSILNKDQKDIIVNYEQFSHCRSGLKYINETFVLIRITLDCTD